jgi:hypothetical protein
MDIPIYWGIEVSPGQKTYFTKLLHELARNIDPGDSLKEVRIVSDDVLASEIQSLTGKPYQLGSYYPEGVAVPIEKGTTFSSAVLIRQVFFALYKTMPATAASLQQKSILVEELYHCRLYHQTWQRRGYLSSRSADPYARDLFAMCAQMHDEYAVARLKNIYFGQYVRVHEQGRLAPYYIEYGRLMAQSLDQVPYQLRARGIFQIALPMRKDAMLDITYRFIFEPLARHAGFLAPIPPDYPLRMPENKPEASVYYRKVIAPHWIPIKSALEASFDSQFSKAEEELQVISETVDAFLG